MVERVSHEGTVVKVDGNNVFVRIVQTSACASCSLSRHCNSAESKEKTVVAQAGADSFRVGESVLVSVSSSLGHKAVSLGFGIPLALLLAVVMAVCGLTGNEPLAALCGVGALIPYYMLLYVFRARIGDVLRITVVRKNS
ncbi:MAG: SoxR reducing system RseC family protein [Prevotella sp.]|nr:SoxR reducing system RseC family protein [Prevotella sp.]